MTIYIWDTQISNIYLGDSPVSAVYVGDTQVWPTAAPQPAANVWPCPAWYHVPNTDENPMETLWWIWLAWDATDMWTYLHIPPMWTLSPTSASKQNLWSECALWSCKGSSDWAAEAFSDWNVGPGKATWIPIRPFKDTPVAPDSSWTQTYDGSSETWISWTWIFYNASAGLISISSDAQNWITIADKNLWATTVYNDGDTMSQANCGNYYQRWNNYGFPFTWPTTTSSTLVDASGYWPSNPYSSSTFIFWQKPSMMAMWEDWSSVANNNLWGWDDI